MKYKKRGWVEKENFLSPALDSHGAGREPEEKPRCGAAGGPTLVPAQRSEAAAQVTGRSVRRHGSYTGSTASPPAVKTQ